MMGDKIFCVKARRLISFKTCKRRKERDIVRMCSSKCKERGE